MRECSYILIRDAVCNRNRVLGKLDEIDNVLCDMLMFIYNVKNDLLSGYMKRLLVRNVNSHTHQT